jgi:hypothetical protein
MIVVPRPIFSAANGGMTITGSLTFTMVYEP